MNENPNGIWAEPSPTPAPAPQPAPQAAPSGLPPDYLAFLRMPVPQRQALRSAHPEAIETLQRAHYTRHPNLRPPDATAPGPTPEATPLPADAFADYASFLRAPAATRAAYRQAHGGIVAVWEAGFARRTAAPSVRLG